MQPVNPLLRLLPIIRLAMISTVFIAGGVIWYLFSQSLEAVTIEPEIRRYINVIYLGLIVVVGLVISFVRRKIEKTAGIDKQCGYVLVGWAAAEGIALMGAVFIMWGDTTLFVAGIMVLIMTFIVIPVPVSQKTSR